MCLRLQPAHLQVVCISAGCDQGCGCWQTSVFVINGLYCVGKPHRFVVDKHGSGTLSKRLGSGQQTWHLGLVDVAPNTLVCVDHMELLHSVAKQSLHRFESAASMFPEEDSEVSKSSIQCFRLHLPGSLINRVTYYHSVTNVLPTASTSRQLDQQGDPS